MVKSDYQEQVEKSNPNMKQSYKVRVFQKKYTPGNYNIGDLVEVDRYSTFGCWDKNNVWYDFYDLEIIQPI